MCVNMNRFSNRLPNNNLVNIANAMFKSEMLKLVARGRLSPYD